jgi:predicted SnoaL-like aldol condensation-catalyzing enzyme
MQLFKAFTLLLITASAQASSKSSRTKSAWLSEWQPTGDYCPPRAASSIEQQSIFNAFVRTFYIENNSSAAMTNYVATDYIQHNPSLLSGRQNAMDFLASYTTNFTFTVQHIGFESNLGWVHVKVESPDQPVTAIFDLYRFNGSCIAEHWDVIQAMPANATNPLALF